jgi:nucleotide-binding universal stress UspA family protein
MTYTCVVVGTDGSATAERAVRHAADLAIVDGARMVVVTAFEGQRRTAMEQLAGTDHEPTGDGRQATPSDLRWMLTDRGQADGVAHRGREIARAAGVNGVVIQSDEGDPAEVLIDAARLYDADLVVVGSVGLVGPQRFLLGSVAASVLHHAPCDVLVVETDRLTAGDATVDGDDRARQVRASP